MIKIPETEIARPVVEYLQDLQWEVFQEVQVHTYGQIADIVAVQNHIVWIIEVKRNFGLSVIGQALGWRPYSHLVSVAIPARRQKTNSAAYEAGMRFIRTEGIGLLSVGTRCVNEMNVPKLNRKAFTRNLLNVLTEEHKTFARAGNSDSKRFSPFQHTSQNVLRAVQMRPGISLKKLISSINTHYQSITTAKVCISKWTREGIIKGVYIKKEGKEIRFYPSLI